MLYEAKRRILDGMQQCSVLISRSIGFWELTNLSLMVA